MANGSERRERPDLRLSFRFKRSGPCARANLARLVVAPLRLGLPRERSQDLRASAHVATPKSNGGSLMASTKYYVRVSGYGIIFRTLSRKRAYAYANRCIPEACATVLTIPPMR